jgi:hypothetical protein
MTVSRAARQCDDLAGLRKGQARLGNALDRARHVFADRIIEFAWPMPLELPDC